MGRQNETRSQTVDPHTGEAVEVVERTYYEIWPFGLIIDNEECVKYAQILITGTIVMLISVPIYHITGPVWLENKAPWEADFWAAFWGWFSCMLVAICLIGGLQYRGAAADENSDPKSKCLHYTGMIGLGLFFSSRLLYRGLWRLVAIHDCGLSPPKCHRSPTWTETFWIFCWNVVFFPLLYATMIHSLFMILYLGTPLQQFVDANGGARNAANTAALPFQVANAAAQPTPENLAVVGRTVANNPSSAAIVVGWASGAQGRGSGSDAEKLDYNGRPGSQGTVTTGIPVSRASGNENDIELAKREQAD